MLVPFSSDQAPAFVSGLQQAATLVAGLTAPGEWAAKVTTLAESRHLRVRQLAACRGEAAGLLHVRCNWPGRVAWRQ